MEEHLRRIGHYAELTAVFQGLSAMFQLGMSILLLRHFTPAKDKKLKKRLRKIEEEQFRAKFK